MVRKRGNHVGELARINDRYNDRETIETIKQTVCKGATDAQLKVFIEVCRATGLSPWLKEIFYVPEKGIIMASRDGYMRVANEHPMFDGMETRVERDEKNIPIKAVCTVWRKDRGHPTVCEAYFNEYVKSSSVWQTYKSAMIGKVAEVLALKRSFSINGVVTEEEIGYDIPAISPAAARKSALEAAKAIAEEKITRMKAGESAEQVNADIGARVDAEYPQAEQELSVESLPQLEAPDPLVSTLEASVAHAEKTKNYEFLRKMGEMKKQVGEALYYRCLGSYGVEHADEVTKRDQQVAIYKELKDLAKETVGA